MARATNKGAVRRNRKSVRAWFLSPFEMYESLDRTNLEIAGVGHGELRSGKGPISHDGACIFAPTQRCNFAGATEARTIQIEDTIWRNCAYPEFATLRHSKSKGDMRETRSRRDLNKMIDTTVGSALR